MEHIHVCKPLLPVTAKLIPYLERIDAQRYYSNIGPLTLEFEKRLGLHFGVPADHIVTSANGTLALVQALKALDVRPGTLCVMPSWTFTATPAAAILAGLVPYFLDVDKARWVIHPEDVIPLTKIHKIGAVVPVAPFGAPLDIAAWEQFQATTGIPVIIDAAAGFDSFSASSQTTKSHISFMVSLHATKVLGIGEGALTVTADAKLAKKIRMLGNFGFSDSRESIVPATNAKLSEYASAIGLAALDEWPETRNTWESLSHQFEAFVKRYPFIKCAPLFNKGWVSSYGLIVLNTPYAAEQVKNALAMRGIGSICWWGKGCHTQLAYQNCPHDDLPTTDALANQILGLPFWRGLEESHLKTVFDSLNEVISEYG